MASVSKQCNKSLSSSTTKYTWGGYISLKSWNTLFLKDGMNMLVYRSETLRKHLNYQNLTMSRVSSAWPPPQRWVCLFFRHGNWTEEILKVLFQPPNNLFSPGKQDQIPNPHITRDGTGVPYLSHWTVFKKLPITMVHMAGERSL